MTRFQFFVAVAAMAASAPALACDCVRLIPGGPRFEEDLDRIATYYPVAAEGVIERNGPYDWRFRPTHEYRGPGRSSYIISLISDCSLDPDAMNGLVGRTVFALLVEGPGDHKGRYEMSRCVNLQSPQVESALRARIEQDCRSR